MILPRPICVPHHETEIYFESAMFVIIINIEYKLTQYNIRSETT